MEDQITKAQSGDGKMETGQREAKPQSMQVYRPRGWLLPAAVTSGVIALVGGGIWWLLWAGQAFSDIAGTVTFVTGGALALALLAVAIVQAAVYWSQRGIMNRQWEAMLEALGEAKKQTQIAGDSLVIGTRSYVGLHSITLNPDKKSVRILIENIGKVPADHIKVFVEMLTMMPDDVVARNERVSSWQRIDSRRDFGEMKLFPGNLQIMISVRLGAKLTDDEFNLILNGFGTLIARGTIDYADGFGAQSTRFFFMYEPIDGWTADAPEEWADIFEGLPPPEGKPDETTKTS